jgi:hypothetical protein|eukprot:COSAG06_NODE_875_length_11812_cov_5.166539_2_plen_38_part_00
MHENWRGEGQDLSGVDFDQFFSWISKRAQRQAAQQDS